MRLAPVQEKLDSASSSRGSNSPKSEDDNIEVLQGEGSKEEKALRDRASGLSLEEDSQEIEAW